MPTKIKLKVREKIALACFMEAVPLLVEKWQKDCPEKSFDIYLLEIYEEAKAVKSDKK